MEELIRFKQLFDTIRLKHYICFKQNEWIRVNGKLFGDGVSFNLHVNGHIMVMFYGCHYSSDMGTITVPIDIDKISLDKIYTSCENDINLFLESIKESGTDMIKNRIDNLQLEIETLKSQLQ